MVVSSCKFLSSLVFKSQPIVIRMDDTKLLATWDDTGNIGVVNLTKAELEEFTTRTGSEKGERLTSMFKNFGISFVCRFECTGDLVDIFDAISHQQRAVNLTPEGHAGMPSQLNNLGSAFQRRFERTGDLADISESISYKQRAVHLTPDGHANMPTWLNNLGNAFIRRFGCTGVLADIFNAI